MTDCQGTAVLHIWIDMLLFNVYILHLFEMYFHHKIRWLIAYCGIAAALEQRRLQIGYETYSLSQVQVDYEPDSWRAPKENIALHSTAAGPNSHYMTNTAGARNWLSIHLYVPHNVYGLIMRGTEFYGHSYVVSFSVLYSIDGLSFEPVADAGENKASILISFKG